MAPSLDSVNPVYRLPRYCCDTHSNMECITERLCKALYSTEWDFNLGVRPIQPLTTQYVCSGVLHCCVYGSGRIRTFLVGSRSDQIVRTRIRPKIVMKQDINLISQIDIFRKIFIFKNIPIQQILNKKQRIVNKTKTIWLWIKSWRKKNLQFLYIISRIRMRTKVVRIRNTDALYIWMYQAGSPTQAPFNKKV